MNLQIRPTSEEDFAHLAECLKKDEFHHLQDPTWWKKDGELVTFYDSKGPILHVKLERVLRVSIQFDNDERRRNAVTLKQGFGWLREMAKKQGFAEIIFDSISTSLIEFCKKHLGFLHSKNEYSVKI